ncbi:hypothetical protein Syun_009399 [Stephania yunnanensis]|uniref:Uncharacterized protein n=1 Tax=Stephania yunnanensis TaxID=152371 RepID=A0AAP0PQU6_9MAGN
MDLGEADIDGIGTPSVCERDTLLVRGTAGSRFREDTKRSRTPSGSDSVKSGDAEDYFDTSTDLADADATSFLKKEEEERKRTVVVFEESRSVANLYTMKYSYGAQLWEDWEGHLEFVEQRVEKAYYSYQVVPDYMEWFHRFNHLFAAIDVALLFRCMPRDNVTVGDVFDMAYQVIAFLSDVEDTYQTTRTTTQSEGGTTSTETIRQYGRNEKEERPLSEIHTRTNDHDPDRGKNGFESKGLSQTDLFILDIGQPLSKYFSYSTVQPWATTLKI